MDDVTKHYTERILKFYNALSEKRKFHFYFEVRGDNKLRIVRRQDHYKSIAKDKAEKLFLRIYKNKYHKFLGTSGVWDESLLVL